MNKKELIRRLNDVPDDAEILIGDVRGDRYGVIHFTTVYDPGQFKDHFNYLDDDNPVSVLMINTKF